MKLYDRSEMDGFKLKKNALPIIETDKDIDMDDLLEINGKLYSVCIKSLNEGWAIVRELNVLVLPDTPNEQVDTNEITCPYCESEIESFEMDDDDADFECPYCHSHFAYQREISVSYNSQPISKAEAIDLVKKIKETFPNRKSVHGTFWR